MDEVASVIWLGLSMLLGGGVDSASAYGRLLWTDLAPITADPGAGFMSNWRALALRWFEDTTMASVATTGLSLVTLGLVIWSWYRRRSEGRDLAPLSFLVLISATLLTAYYSVAYNVALLLVPALCYLVELGQRSDAIAKRWSAIVDFTLLGPSAALALNIFLIRFSVNPGVVLPIDVLIGSLVAILVMGIFVPTESEIAAERLPIRDNELVV